MFEWAQWAQAQGPNEWAQMGPGPGPNEWAQWARAQGPNESQWAYKANIFMTLRIIRADLF